MITVVGLGPAGPELVGPQALEAASSSERVFLRTARHPAATAVLERRPDATSFDPLYESAESFEAVYGEIADALVGEAARGASVCYAVPGSPNVGERTVGLVREAARERGVAVAVAPALSFLDLCFERLALDPVTAGLRVVDASGFAEAAAGGAGPLLVAQAWSRELLSDVKLSVDRPAAGQEVILLHHLGLADERVLCVAWAELDRALEPDHLTSLYVPAGAVRPGAELAALDETVATLRQRCPWDREQTHASLLRHLLEEAYEAAEALDALGESPASCGSEVAAHAEEELGDVLCQVVFHARLGAEEGLFTLADVARSANSKLVERHPHVFGDVVARTADDVVDNWERLKDAAAKRTHLLEGVPAAMPALLRTEKLERKLRSVGLGWESTGEGFDELAARFAGVVEELAATGRQRAPGRPAAGGASGDEAVGDLLLQLVRLLAHRGVDAEASLRRALGRVGARVAQLEAEAREAGTPLHDWADLRRVRGAFVRLC